MEKKKNEKELQVQKEEAKKKPLNAEELEKVSGGRSQVNTKRCW